jgi:hypothetical protein
MDKQKVIIYSEIFKRKVVSEIENGIFTRSGARQHYGISGKMTVYRWCEKYGNSLYNQPNSKIKSMTRTSKREPSVKELEQTERIKSLEKALVDAQLHIQTLKTAIDIAEEQFDIKIQKKFGTKQ